MYQLDQDRRGVAKTNNCTDHLKKLPFTSGGGGGGGGRSPRANEITEAFDHRLHVYNFNHGNLSRSLRCSQINTAVVKNVL